LSAVAVELVPEVVARGADLTVADVAELLGGLERRCLVQHLAGVRAAELRRAAAEATARGGGGDGGGGGGDGGRGDGGGGRGDGGGGPSAPREATHDR
jgi:hypothetical protein